MKYMDGILCSMADQGIIKFRDRDRHPQLILEMSTSSSTFLFLIIMSASFEPQVPYLSALLSSPWSCTNKAPGLV